MSPLRVLRASFEEDTTAPDPLRGLVLAVVVLFIVVSILQPILELNNMMSR